MPRLNASLDRHSVGMCSRVLRSCFYPQLCHNLRTSGGNRWEALRFYESSTFGVVPEICGFASTSSPFLSRVLLPAWNLCLIFFPPSCKTTSISWSQTHLAVQAALVLLRNLYFVQGMSKACFPPLWVLSVWFDEDKLANWAIGVSAMGILQM